MERVFFRIDTLSFLQVRLEITKSPSVKLFDIIQDGLEQKKGVNVVVGFVFRLSFSR